MARASTDNVQYVYENTYRINATEDERFIPSSVEACIKEVVDKKLEGKEYDHEASKIWSAEILSEIEALISKRLGLERYKLVLLGHIFQNGGQSLRVATKCLWDPQNDNFVDYNYVNDELMCSIQVFGIYIQ